MEIAGKEIKPSEGGNWRKFLQFGMQPGYQTLVGDSLIYQ